MKRQLKLLNEDSSQVSVISCKVPQQSGNVDCGLYALGYAIAIAEQIDPSCIEFDQSQMPQRFHWMLENKRAKMFEYKVIEPLLNSNGSNHTHKIDVSGVNIDI